MKYIKLFERWRRNDGLPMNRLQDDFEWELEEIFPWDKEILAIVENIQANISKIQKDTANRQYERDGESSVSYNVKVYDRPEGDEDGEAYQTFLDDHLTMFIEDLENEDWVEQCTVEGRSGGWLVVTHELDLQALSFQVQGMLEEYEKEYHYDSSGQLIKVFTPEEIRRLRGSVALDDFGIKTSVETEIGQRSEIFKDAKSGGEELIKDLKIFEKNTAELADKIEDLESEIEDKKKDLLKKFKQARILGDY